MARLPAIAPKDASWTTRALYFFARRKVRQLTGVDRLPEPLQITAHHPRLLLGLGQMEMAFAAARSLPERLKTLASIQAATLIGCPY